VDFHEIWWVGDAIEDNLNATSFNLVAFSHSKMADV
jgi:hypothetical protein